MELETVEVNYWMMKSNGKLVADLNIGGKRQIRYTSDNEDALVAKVKSFIKRNKLQEVRNGLLV